MDGPGRINVIKIDSGYFDRLKNVPECYDKNADFPMFWKDNELYMKSEFAEAYAELDRHKYEMRRYHFNFKVHRIDYLNDDIPAGWVMEPAYHNKNLRERNWYLRSEEALCTPKLGDLHIPRALSKISRQLDELLKAVNRDS